MSTSTSSTTFGRELSFLDVALNNPPAWWPELLSLWCPAGTPAGALGLRLAIRNGTLNLYRKGQSVAQVRQNRAGQMQWILHRKYIERTERGDMDAGRRYLTAPADVQLARWVKAAEGKAGAEKIAIDEILDHDANVIDLEMGLPASGDQKFALRIDMVSLEHVDAATTRLMFWEVKTFDDARIRTSGPLPTDSGILRQVKTYQKFLSDPHRATQVCSAYQRCAKVLQLLAQSIHAEQQLGAELRALASGKTLVLADQPGLLVALPTRELPTRSKAAWNVHRRKLEDAGMKLRIEKVQSLD